jgi:phosphoglycolate phosphatase
MNCKAILFDFDGTLSRPNVDFQRMRKTILNLLSSYGVETGNLENLFVLEMVESGRRILDQVDKSAGADFDRRAHDLIRDMEVEGATRSNLIPGIREMLLDARNLDIGTGVVTRNCREAVLEVFPDILSFCDTLVTRESTLMVKPNPEQILIALKDLNADPSVSLTVGDHPMDIRAGKEAGTFTVGVLTGYSNADALLDAGADLVVESAAQLVLYLP